METVINAALERICEQGVKGIEIRALWSTLTSPLSSVGLVLSPSVKRALWAQIVDIPGLKFESEGSKSGGLIRDVEQCEQMNVKIVAGEKLRDCFLGIYDVKSEVISTDQRRTLERLAIAGSEGVAQNELAKEFGIKGNKIFYILKKLETRGLISRQSTIIRTKEASRNMEPNNSSIVATNMLRLSRFAKPLGCQQRFEITKEERRLVDGGFADGEAANDDGYSGELAKEDIMVKDYLPALKAICDKLDKATDNVLVVSDIKRDLGYCGTSGHRAWRNIFHRLKDAHVVEDFTAKVNNKEVNCLRLLKKFSAQHFDNKNHAHRSNEQDPDQSLELGKRGHVSEQLMELPIEQQIYDMIDAEGSKGLVMTEALKRLGISNKKFHDRLINMYSRFGVHLEPESYNRTYAYRAWTSGNFNSEASNIDSSHQIVVPETTESNPQEWKVVSSSPPVDSAFNERQIVLHGSMEQNLPIQNQECNIISCHTIQEMDDLAYKDDGGSVSLNKCIAIGSDIFDGSTTNKQSNSMLQFSNNIENSSSKSGDVPRENLQMVLSTSDDLQLVSSTSDDLQMVSPTSPTEPKRRRRSSYKRYPCLKPDVVSSLREQRILKMLQEERFLIKHELLRRLESFDKDKKSMMDRKTLDRSLNKLQQEGHCKCIPMSVPVITNFGRSRITEVVLHPSAYDLSPLLVGQIHEKMRSSEMQIRQHCSRLNKGEEVPELNNVQRIPYHPKSDIQSGLAEAMRTNGFVISKMVRTKILHIFLWEYISSSPGWDNDLSNGRQGHDLHNPHSSCKLLEPDVAIKTMPIEVFLQIAGSTHRFEDMIEKCKRGVLLSDLSDHEYKSLMDTGAKGRISRLIDILCRLKLIRSVIGGIHDMSKPSHTIVSYSLELKPYLEEPASTIRSSLGFFSADMRPQIRHDFVLSNRKAVDDYWKTLEYCYSTADTKAALHAFPGSVVHEISKQKSWSLARVMTAGQRAELLKRVGNQDPDKKLTFRECDQIAKDLNLTMDQVCRVDYDRRHQRLSRLYGKKQGVHRLDSTNISLSWKRKRSSDRKSSKHIEEALEDGQLCSRDQFDEEQYTCLTPEDDEYSLHDDNINEYEEAGEDVEPSEDEDNIGFKCALLRLKPKRQKKFSWTELADRQLVTEYARHRGALGAKFNRANWASLSNLPAPPDSCRRRMACLMSTALFRKSMMRLCNKLTNRYAKFLEKFQCNSAYTGGSGGMVRENLLHGDNHNIADGSGNVESEEDWDNFREPDVQAALNDVLRCIKAGKQETSRGVEDAEDAELISSPPSNEAGASSIKPKVGQRSGTNCLPPRYSKFLREGSSVNKAAYKSVAISNAIELLKLIFLSTSPETPAFLAETLRRYSEHDLLAAFNHLREKKILVGGICNTPFELSQHFLRSISMSPFPVDTGKRAAKFAHWLQEKERELTEEVIELPEELQCGDLMHLCALISLEELSITPLLPDEGVGEAEDAKTFKRKHDDPELCSSEKSKKLRSSIPGEGEIISRREKGFPGIKLWLNVSAMSRIDSLQLFKDSYTQAEHITEQNEGGTRSGMEDCNAMTHPHKPSCMSEPHDSRKSLHLTDLPARSPWEAMASFAKHLLSSCASQEHAYSFHPDLFRKTCVAIHKAGDQGLSIKEVSKIMNIEGERILDITTEVLVAFGQALKVNTYDSEHMVHPLYRSKYFLIPVAGLPQDPKFFTSRNFKKKKDVNNFISDVDDHKASTGSCMKMSQNPHDMHRVTILNFLEEVSEPVQGSQSSERNASYTNSEGTSAKSLEQDALELHPTGSDSYKPILPWINGDGTINEAIYKGLVRRILGITMQNPGILEEDIIKKLLPILNPQSCRKILKVMILNDHISVRKMSQKTSAGPPSILCSMLESRLMKSTIVCREHLFANPSSTMLM